MFFITYIQTMDSLLPLAYLSILVIILSIVLFILIKQIVSKRALEIELYTLQSKVRNKTATQEDYYALGIIYLSKKLFDQAIVQFSYALKQWDKSDKNGLAILFNTIGFTYFESEQYDLSIYYYNEAISNLPNYTIALNNVAYSYEKKKLVPEAIQAYKKVLTYDADNETATQRIALLGRRLKIRDDRI